MSQALILNDETSTLKTNQRESKKKPFTVADLFCGAGGASTGASRALAAAGLEMDLSCVNHWPIAIESHKSNHPNSNHFCQDISALRPIVAVPSGQLDLLMASPTCTFHSKARGGKPTSDQQRMDPWHIITWLTELRVKRLIIENVPEYTSWGPISLKTGRPIESRRGEYFNAWVDAIRRLGFKIEWAVLNCADYGDPTTRMRFFLLARSDGKTLKWPTKTHSKSGTPDLFGTGAQKWRGAAEVLDWNIKGKSIYARKKSLSSKTLLRILSGIVRYEWQPGYAERLIKFMLDQGVDQQTINDVCERSRPKGGKRKAINAFILNRHGENGSVRAHDPAEPMPTADCRGAGYLVQPPSVEPFIAVVAHGDEKPTDSARRTRDIQTPLDTIHAGGNAFALVEPGFTLTQASGGAPRSVEQPVPTIVSTGAVALIAPYYGEGSGETCKSTDDPLPTVTTKSRFGVVTTPGQLAEEVTGKKIIITNNGPMEPSGIRDDHALIFPLTHHGHGNRSRPVSDPLPVLTCARGELGFITGAFGEREGQLPRTHDIDAPMPTLCAQGHVNLVMAENNTTNDYDILFRMLLVRELARATSLDEPGKPYILLGNATDQIKQIGNAVPSKTAEALVRAMI